MNFNQIPLFGHPKRPGYFLTEQDLVLETKINLIYSKREFAKQQWNSGPTGLCFLVLKPTDSKEELHPTYRLGLLQALLTDYNLEVDYLPQVGWQRPEVTGKLVQKISNLAAEASGDYVIYGSKSLNTFCDLSWAVS